jgi:cytochrome P450
MQQKTAIDMVPRFWESKESPVEGIPVIPYGTWFTGHLHLLLEPDFRKSLHKFSVEHADEQGRCTFWMGPTTPSLSVTRCEDVQTLLKVSSHRELFPVMQLHLDKFFGTHNIANLTGNEWKSKRAAIIKALHGRKVIEHNQQAFHQAVETLVESISTNNVEFVQDISLFMKLLTLDAFGLATLNKDFGCCKRLKASRIMKDFEYMSSEVMRRMTKGILNPASHVYQLPTAANKKHQQVLGRMEDYLFDLIDERRAQMAETSNADEIPQDLLTSLIEEVALDGVGDEDSVDEETMYHVLADTIKSLIFAGYETSSVTLTYVLYLLSLHPDVEARCMDEIRSKPQQPVYMEAVIREALRLFPPIISTTRSLEREVRFGGIQVPKGTYLYFPIWVIQRDERHFKWPLKFLPERWARYDESTESWVQRHHGESDDFEGVPAGNLKAFVAFSSGARSCAGQRFAMQEMTIALSVLLENFKFEVPDDFVLSPHREGFVQCPKGGVPMRIIKRSTPKMVVQGEFLVYAPP